MLEDGRGRGLLGPGPVEPQIEHSLGFAAAIGSGSSPALDLGTGGGLPGLVLALAEPSILWTLLDARRRSAAFVGEAVERLELGDRVTVVEGRAEDVGRVPAHRGRYQVVTARGFGGPAATAECAAPLLAVGGALVVSEPPDSEGGRWPSALERLGMRFERIERGPNGTFAVVRQVGPCPSTFPRRSGIPAKRPLFP